MFFKQQSQHRILLKAFTALGLGLLNANMMLSPLTAAEEIDFIYSPLIESLDVGSLETFAIDGTIPPDLKFYLNLVDASPQELALLQTALTRRVEIDPILLARVFKTDEGDRLLTSFGEIVKIQGGRNAKFALRGAIINSAFDEQGLTLLNVLKNLQVNVQVDIENLFRFAGSIKVIVDGTEKFVNEVERLSQQEAKPFRFVNYARRPDLRQQTTTPIKTETWLLNDAERDREFYVLVHRPQTLVGEKIPVVVISHGLASQPEEKSKLAQHLASYGFVVVSPQHPGSDEAYLRGFIEGYHRQISDLNEFINRPLDITFTLDELERRNATEFAGRLDVEHVGIFGHSYGGYTALAVAGAFPVPNLEHLERDCGAEWGVFNNALLLQCRALQLESPAGNFRDERIQAVVAANPVNASIFGEEALSEVKIPITVIAGSYDPATPFIFEQVRSFPWLDTSEKYLVLEEGQAHIDISKLDLGISRLLERIPSLNLPSPNLLNNYSEAIALAFFQVYVAQNEQYRPYLNPAYSAYLSEGQEFKAFMVTAKSVGELEAAIAEFKREYQIDTDN
ncbi:MAG: alpha/beta hydrolase [Limnothrix sp.]